MTTKKGIPLSFDDVIQVHTMLMALASELISLRRKRSFLIHTKADGSPVTSGDYLAHQKLTAHFSLALPHFSIISEEMNEPQNAIPTENTLFLDPIDGTKHFIEGKNPFFCLIGFMQNGIPTQGIHFRMDNGDILFNIDNEVFFRSKEGKVILMKVEKHPDKILSMKMLDTDKKQELLDLGYKREKYQYKHLELVHPLFSKSCGMISRRRTWFWDICAPAAIMRAAGFSFSMFNEENKQIDFNNSPIFAHWWSCLHYEHFFINNQFI